MTRLHVKGLLWLLPRYSGGMRRPSHDLLGEIGSLIYAKHFGKVSVGSKCKSQ